MTPSSASSRLCRRQTCSPCCEPDLKGSRLNSPCWRLEAFRTDRMFAAKPSTSVRARPWNHHGSSLPRRSGARAGPTLVRAPWEEAAAARQRRLRRSPCPTRWRRATTRTGRAGRRPETTPGDLVLPAGGVELRGSLQRRSADIVGTRENAERSRIEPAPTPRSGRSATFHACRDCIQTNAGVDRSSSRE